MSKCYFNCLNIDVNYIYQWYHRLIMSDSINLHGWINLCILRYRTVFIILLSGYACWLCKDGSMSCLTRPRQNGCHFADGIFKCIFLNENVWISLKISMKSVPGVRITGSNIPTLVEIMAWRQATSHYLNQWWLNYRRIYASLGLIEITVVRFHDEALPVIRCLTAQSHYMDQRCIITKSRGVHLRAMAKGYGQGAFHINLLRYAM